MRKAVIKQTDGFVENVIEIEEGANWRLPEGYELVDGNDASPGDTWDGSQFIKPILEGIVVRDLEAELDALKVRIEKLEAK